ncbi:endocuticle structural glycoprotein SgAbd-8-like isoform X2 [Adelges cooleyi]|nr:endocuticle structural glycoprotein SgAbd-8-like isoform X2 [Adelges cooleyi]XP_050437331.1 endocuticle structural glycoprotein SgAbd-8-like isoform X2 [Adelges cooleyi]
MFTATVLYSMVVNVVLSSATLQYTNTEPLPVALIRHDHVVDNNGQFALAFESADGISQSKQGALVLNDEGDGYVMIQQGSYEYRSPEGILVRMVYRADKNGFHVTGFPLPVQQQQR